MAIVLMSGAAAEQVLMESGPLSNGWHKDFDIARIGLGWIYKGRDHSKDCLELFGQAKEAIRKDADSVIRVAEALIGTRSLTGDEVASLMAAERVSGFRLVRAVQVLSPKREKPFASRLGRMF